MTASTGRANRRRGITYERAVVAYLRARGVPADRTPTGRHVDGGDVDGLPGWLVEVKNHARLDLAGWLDLAATKAARSGRRPLLVVKRRGVADPGEHYAVLRLTDLLDTFDDLPSTDERNPR